MIDLRNIENLFLGKEKEILHNIFSHLNITNYRDAIKKLIAQYRSMEIHVGILINPECFLYECYSKTDMENICTKFDFKGSSEDEYNEVLLKLIRITTVYFLELRTNDLCQENIQEFCSYIDPFLFKILAIEGVPKEKNQMFQFSNIVSTLQIPTQFELSKKRALKCKNNFNGMLMEDVVKYFSALFFEKNKKGEPYIDEIYLFHFIYSAFYKTTPPPTYFKIKLNISSKEKLLIHEFFHYFHKLSCSSPINETRKSSKQFYVRLLTDYFDGFEYPTVFHNFVSKKENTDGQIKKYILLSGKKKPYEQ